MNEPLEANRWNTEFREKHRYEGESPVSFVDDILAELGEEGKNQMGLYVGCGSGRNFLPLADAGLSGLRGMDISQVAINQIIEKRPGMKSRLYCGNLNDMNIARVFDYIVAI